MGGGDPRGFAVGVYCGGERAEAVPVYLATFSLGGRPKVDKVPLYYRCSCCGEVYNRVVT